MGMTILFQGDSITDGGRLRDSDRSWDLNHQMGHSYAFGVNTLLGSQYPEKDYNFINRGISGNRVTDLYARIQEDFLNLKPDVLSILVGVNDIWHQLNTGIGNSPKRYERVYRLILDEVKEALPNTKVVMMEPFVLPVGAQAENYDKFYPMLTEVRVIVKKLAEEYGHIFIPLQEKFEALSKTKDPSYWLWDGVHPTVSGHGFIAKEWIEATKSIL